MNHLGEKLISVEEKLISVKEFIRQCFCEADPFRVLVMWYFLSLKTKQKKIET